MKKLYKLAWLIVFAILLTVPAFADVAVGPMYAAIIGVPILAIAVLIIVIVLLAKLLSGRKKK